MSNLVVLYYFRYVLCAFFSLLSWSITNVILLTRIELDSLSVLLDIQSNLLSGDILPGLSPNFQRNKYPFLFEVRTNLIDINILSFVVSNYVILFLKYP